MKACKPKRPLDPALRRYSLSFAVVFGSAFLVAGYYWGLKNLVGQAPAHGTPAFELFFMHTFIAISCGAAGVIIGAFVGSVIYRIKSKGR